MSATGRRTASGFLNKARRKLGIPRAAWPWILLAACLSVLLFATAAYKALRSADSSEPGTSTAESSYYKVEPKTISKLVRMTGVIAPAESKLITAPFAGIVAKVHAAVGSQVRAGDLILSLDTTELEAQRGEARNALSQSYQKFKDLSNWKSSTEVSRAQRAADRSGQQLKKLRTEIAEARKLFDMGIIARQELDSLIDQEREAVNSFAYAKEELSSVLKKNEGYAVRAAEIEFDNAKKKLQQIEDRLSAATIHAPSSGTLAAVVTTVEGASQEARELTAGTKVAEGQKLFVIVSTENIQIRAKVPEIDIGALKVGMPVRATLVAFPEGQLSGRIVRISDQASNREGDGGISNFDVIVQVQAWDNKTDGAKLRLGMSSSMEAVVFEKQNALVIPASAIKTDDARNNVVTRRSAATGKLETVAVTLGESLPEGVEITSGLSAGDEVAL